MHFAKLLIAAAATVVAAGASAQVTSVKLTGASATQKNLIAGLNNLCVANGGTMDVYENSSNIKTYVCQGATLVDDVTTVRHNVSGGSLNALLAVGAAKLPFATTTCTTTSAAAHVPPVSGVYKTGCSLSAAEDSNGGLMDVSPNSVVDKLLAAPSYSTIDVAFAQVFGVAVSDQLYLKLYRQQRALTGQNKVIDTTCPAAADTDANIRAAYTLPECQPTVSKADISAIMNNNLSNRFKTAGVGGFGLPTGKLTYARRADTSGTQSAAEIYFLDAGKPAADTVVTAGTVVGANYEALNLSGSSNVVNVLKCGTSATCAANTAGDRIGLLSTENFPADANAGWRYVRLNEVSVADGYPTASPAFTPTNTVSAIAGRYDYVFDSIGVAIDTAGDEDDAVTNLLTAIAGNTAFVSPGLYRNQASAAPESRYGRGGDALAPFKRQ